MHGFWCARSYPHEMAQARRHTQPFPGLVLTMIYVKPAILTELEEALGCNVSDKEFNARYRPWLVRVNRWTQKQDGEERGARECAEDAQANSADSAREQAADGCLEAQA
jgi:hypothetical protein